MKKSPLNCCMEKVRRRRKRSRSKLLGNGRNQKQAQALIATSAASDTSTTATVKLSPRRIVSAESIAIQIKLRRVDAEYSRSLEKQMLISGGSLVC